MLRCTLLALLLLPAPAFATGALKLSLSGSYGNCDQQSTGGGSSLSDAGYGDDALSCVPVKVRGTHVTFQCTDEDASGEENYKSPRFKTTVIESRATGTATIAGLPGGVVTMHRCK